MDPDSSWPTRAHQQPTSPREPPARDPASRFRRSPPKPARDVERSRAARGGAASGLGRPRFWAAAGAQTKPLLPVAERRSHEDNLAGRRGKHGSQDDDKWDIAPDGGSAGREGRQFAVANVGNNGRIYLR